MCGIAGVIRSSAGALGPERLGAVLDAIAHRGPDEEGQWTEGGVWLGHRRLSVIDLSPAGSQPMFSADGRWVIAFNGEIYNHRAMRRELESLGVGGWRGHSDTETLVEAVARFGPEAALKRANGMFALALWDRREEQLFLARDRLGEKPVYYTTLGGGFAFASELTALERLADLDLKISPQALSLYFRNTYVPAPFSIYSDVFKLPPGEMLAWRRGEAPRRTAYWSINDAIRCGQANRLLDENAAVDALDELLRDVVAARMEADVPLGAFLSGGVDSSMVVAMMQASTSTPVRTFTLGFDVPDFDEAGHAADVAHHLRTDHTEHYVTTGDAQRIVPLLGAMFDEPFADSSQIPTFLISQMARRHVTVCLTGDGGDEMFGGYLRYSGVPAVWAGISRLPARRPIAAMLDAAPLDVLERGLGFLGPVARRYSPRGPLGPKLRRLATWLPARSQADLYDRAMSAWAEPEELLAQPFEPPRPWRACAPAFDNEMEEMLWRDTVEYLPGDILFKVDRASMATSLETRAPFLDPEIAAFVWRLPPAMKLRGGISKWLLRQVLYRYVPRKMIDRPKMGFSVPLHAWLTGDLRDWAEALIAPDVIRAQGLLNPAPVARIWRRYLDGDTSADTRVWSLLMFQAWLAARGR